MQTGCGSGKKDWCDVIKKLLEHRRKEKMYKTLCIILLWIALIEAFLIWVLQAGPI